MALVKYNNNSISAITTAGQLATGGMVLIKEQTASDSSSITFTHGTSDVVFDSTYPIYLFKFINIDNSTTSSGNKFSFQSSTDNTNYNITCTNTCFQSYHVETGAYSSLEYTTGNDHAQDTGFIKLNSQYIGAQDDASCCGELFYFNPSSTTFVKHYMATTQFMHTDSSNSHSWGTKTAGYFNTTSAITSVQFKFSSGNIRVGTIKLYGIKDS